MPAKSTSAATQEHMRRAAHRAVDDPAELARAARIVRAALARKRITIEELTASSADGGGRNAA